MTIIVRENEKIIKEARQHIVFFLPRLLIWAVILAFLFAWGSYGNFDYFGYGNKIPFMASVLGFILVAWKIFVWKNTVLVLTDQRVWCQIREGIFSNKAVEFLYRDIKQLSYSKKGFWQSVLNYGTLELHTSSDVAHLFTYVSRPDDIVNLVSAVR